MPIATSLVRTAGKALLMFVAVSPFVSVVSAAAVEPFFLGKTPAQWQRQLRDPSETARLQATVALGQIGSAASDPLLAELSHKEPCIRHWAAAGLGAIAAAKDTPAADRERIEAALRVRLRDESATVRISAAAALARCGQLGIALPVLAAALEDPIAGARIQAASALSELGDAARPALAAIRAAKEDSNEYVVRLATRMLARLEGEGRGR